VRTIHCSTLALAILALSLAPTFGADTAPKKADPVVVPFELLASGHMAVKVKANGKGPFLLIFDTGAPMSLVNNKMAKEAGLLKGVQKPAFTMFGSMGEVKIKTLQVGDATADDVSAMVMDHPTITLIADKLKKPICGLVGFPFFARFKMTIDYEKKTMTLVPSGYKPPDGMKAMTILMLAGAGRRYLAPAAQWGVMASKETGDEADGVDVKSIVPGSAADKAGLKRGDRLLTLDGRWTDTIADLYEAAGYVKLGSTVDVKIKRGGKEMSLKVSPVKGL
jgi:Aspartyl protease/PDZ domain